MLISYFKMYFLLTLFPVFFAKLFPYIETSDCASFGFLSSFKINIHKSEIKPVIIHFHYNEYSHFIFVLLTHMPAFLTCSFLCVLDFIP